jgi:hypothetical protein
MEVEVKIRLDDAAAHQKVAQLLAPSHQVTHLQENVFFDGARQQLSSKRMVLRLRFYNGDERCVVTLKGKAVIIEGISRGSEVLPSSLSLDPEQFFRTLNSGQVVAIRVNSQDALGHCVSFLPCRWRKISTWLSQERAWQIHRN